MRASQPDEGPMLGYNNRVTAVAESYCANAIGVRATLEAPTEPLRECLTNPRP